MRVFVVISKETKEKNISQCYVINVGQRAINIINCAQEGASLITEQEAVKEEMHICFYELKRCNLIRQKKI